MDPEDNIGTAGFCTVSVAPYGYTNDGVLETGGNMIVGHNTLCLLLCGLFCLSIHWFISCLCDVSVKG